MTRTAICGRFVPQSTHGVRLDGGIVTLEGGGQRVPTLGGGNGPGLAKETVAEREPAR
jgi:hypothetical protein